MNAFVGRHQIRFYRFTDDRLTLRTVPLQIGDGVQTGELIWQRIGEIS
nr:lipocalin-like domain-containing protein [Serratia sp. PAMC26656]